jgi:hypothetical protein
MATVTLERKVEMTVKECGTCGIPYAVPDYFEAQRRKDHLTFYCPNGHARYYTEQPDENAAELKKKLDLEKRLREAAEADARYARNRQSAAENSLRATKGVVTKLKRRVGNGVCPCCGRTFSQLARHMANKHPDFAEEQSDGE